MVGNDAAPEFHAKVLPPGSAPAENTFQPNPINEVPGQADNENVLRGHGKESTKTSALDSIPGATSGDVHKGLGHPGQGQTSADKDVSGRSGLMGVGASGVQSGMGGVDERTDASQRGIEKEGSRTKDTVGEFAAGAEERLPATADEVAAERD